MTVIGIEVGRSDTHPTTLGIAHRGIAPGPVMEFAGRAEPGSTVVTEHPEVAAWVAGGSGGAAVVVAEGIELPPGQALPVRRLPRLEPDPAWRSVVVALSPADGHEGQFRFVVGSAAEDVPLNAPPPHPSESSLRAVPLGAGEGVAIADGLTWTSYPNNSGRPTRFALLTVLPRGRRRLTRMGPRGPETMEPDDDELVDLLRSGTVPEGGWTPTSPTATAPSARPARAGVSRLGSAVGDRRALAARLRVLSATLGATTRAVAGARADRAPVGALAAEAAVSLRSPLRDTADDPELLRTVLAVEADRPVWEPELRAAVADGDLPSTAFLTGREDPPDGRRDGRFVLVNEGRWVDRNLERCTELAARLRDVPGLVAASAVTAETDPPQDPVAPGCIRATIHLDAPDPLRWERAGESATPSPGLRLEVVADPPGRLDPVGRLATALRPYRPSAYWVDHRLAVFGGIDAAEEEPPEGVIVDSYEDFGRRRGGWSLLRTPAGRRELFDRASIPAIMSVVRVNNFLLDHHLRGTGAILDPATFPWVAEVERAWPEIRAEADALLASGQWVPSVREVAGIESEQDRPAIGTSNRWRNFIFYHRGQWMDWNCSLCPRTTQVVRDIPELNFAFFSILEPHGHIVRHRGPNRGALRHHLGVRIPDPPESCRININGVDHHWHDGETLVFDLTSEHEVWNDSDQPRVLLMCEMNTPLPRRLRGINRMTQAVYSLMPPFRRMKAHLRGLEAAERLGTGGTGAGAAAGATGSAEPSPPTAGPAAGS